ncbi:hypothetical protein C8Q77DRAFT_654023 [Trametes polyzona]|nr:hypothetical protein C8Q77DRAFT_654023 [Trametes polyzona]
MLRDPPILLFRGISNWPPAGKGKSFALTPKRPPESKNRSHHTERTSVASSHRTSLQKRVRDMLAAQDRAHCLALPSSQQRREGMVGHGSRHMCPWGVRIAQLVTHKTPRTEPKVAGHCVRQSLKRRAYVHACGGAASLDQGVVPKKRGPREISRSPSGQNADQENAASSSTEPEHTQRSGSSSHSSSGQSQRQRQAEDTLEGREA